MDAILAVGNTEDIRKRIRNCRKMETLKKCEYGLKETKIMVARTRKEEVEQTDERVQHNRAHCRWLHTISTQYLKTRNERKCDNQE